MRSDWTIVKLANALFVIALAGCVATPASEYSTPPSVDIVQDDPGPAQPMGTVLDESRREAFTQPYTLDGCHNPRFLFPLEPEYAKSLLPPGFEPEDAAVVFDALHAPRPSQLVTGKAVGGYDVVRCLQDSYSGEELRFSNVFVFVQFPSFEGVEPVDVEIYVLDAYLTNDAWARLYGPPVVDTKPASIESQLGTSPGTGWGKVQATSASMDVDYQLVPNGPVWPQLDFKVRGWHVSEAGTSTFTVVEIPHSETSGQITSCTHPAGSVYEKVSGTKDCKGSQHVVVAGVDQDGLQGVLQWFPGQFPRVPTEAAGSTVVTWSGRIQAGAASEAPAHWRDTAVAGELLFGPAMQDIDLLEMPSMLRADLEWSGQGRLQLMVNDLGHEGTMHEFIAPGPQSYSDSPRLCVTVPVDALHEGTWQFMPHSAAAVDLEYTITVTVGGPVVGPTQHKEAWPTIAEYFAMHARGKVEQRAASC